MENAKTLSDSVEKVSLTGDELIIGLDGREIKIKLSVLKTYLGIAATGNVVPAKVPGLDLGAPADAKFYVGGPGTYTLNGVTEQYSDVVNFFFWDKSEWDVLEVPIVVPQAENKIGQWTAKAYTAGQQAIDADIWWEAVVNTTAAQRPGVVAETIWKKATKTVEIVNDLTTGGADKAASAEVAKDLNNNINSVDDKINNVFLSDPDPNRLLSLVDKEGDIIIEVLDDGALNIPGLDNSVQEELAKNAAKYGIGAGSPDDHLQIISADDEMVARIAKDGSLFLPGLGVSVQEAVGGTKSLDMPVQRQYRDLFKDETLPYFAAISNSQMGFAPCPFNLAPQNYTVPDSIVNAFRLPPPTGRIKIDTPYGIDDKVVHPYIIEFYGTFRGYRYLMVINPYSFEDHENPVVYGSHDLNSFEMLTGFVQPLATPLSNDYLSDSGFAYDPLSGELVCYYRYAKREGSSTYYWILCRTTKDGVNWSEIKPIIQETPSRGLVASPSFLYDYNTKMWHMWACYTQGSQIEHRTSKTLYNDWSEPTLYHVGDTQLWHFEVKYVGDKFVMLILDKDPTSNFYMGISSNGENWTWGTVPLFETQQDALYKATFLPVLGDDNTIMLEVLWTTNHGQSDETYRRLFRSQTNKINLS